MKTETRVPSIYENYPGIFFSRRLLDVLANLKVLTYKQYGHATDAVMRSI